MEHRSPPPLPTRTCINKPVTPKVCIYIVLKWCLDKRGDDAANIRKKTNKGLVVDFNQNKSNLGQLSKYSRMIFFKQ